MGECDHYFKSSEFGMCPHCMVAELTRLRARERLAFGILGSVAAELGVGHQPGVDLAAETARMRNDCKDEIARLRAVAEAAEQVMNDNAVDDPMGDEHRLREALRAWKEGR